MPKSAAALERFTLNLTPAGSSALRMLLALPEADNKTDTVIRALKICAYIEKQRAEGARVLLSSPSGEVHEVHFV